MALAVLPLYGIEKRIAVNPGGFEPIADAVIVITKPENVCQTYAKLHPAVCVRMKI